MMEKMEDSTSAASTEQPMDNLEALEAPVDSAIVQKAEDPEENDEMDDLFGDDSENESQPGSEEKEERGSDEDDEGVTNGRRSRGIVDEDDEDDEQAMYNRKFYGDKVDEDDNDDDSQAEFKEADIDIVKHTVPYKTVASDSHSTLYYTKVPQFLTIDPIPFDPPAFQSKIEERLNRFSSKEDQLGDRLIDENTVRWRYSRDANQRVFKESNAQIIQWSDGTFSLRLGEEYTDVLINDTDNTYLAVSHEEQELVQSIGGGEISKTMMFIPTSTNSRIHQKLSNAVVRREEREHQGPSTYIVRVDPELEQRELEKKQGQIIRERRKRQLREQLEKENRDSPDPVGLRKSTSSFGHARGNEYEDDGFMVDDDEDDLLDDEEEEMEDEEDEEDDLNAERLRQLKRDGAMQYQGDESEDDAKDSAEEEATVKRRKIALVDEDEDDE